MTKVKASKRLRAKPVSLARETAVARRGRSSRGSKVQESEVASRRHEIVQIAARLFAECGFGATTIRVIADEAHILSGSIYHHFDTKDEILHEVIRDAVTFLRDSTTQISKSECDAERKLVALIRLSLDVHARDHQAYSILYNERRLLRQRDGFEYVAQAKGDMYRAWQAVLQDGVAAGLFKPNLDLFLTISTINRMLNTCADWFHHDRIYEHRIGPFSLDKVVAFNLDFILGAIRHPKRISQPIPRQDSA